MQTCIGIDGERREEMKERKKDDLFYQTTYAPRYCEYELIRNKEHTD